MAFWSKDKAEKPADNGVVQPAAAPPQPQAAPQAAPQPAPQAQPAAQPQAQPPAAAQGQPQAAPQGTKAHPGAVFGEIVTVLMRAPQYRGLTLQDLEWLVLPALQHNQFHLALDQKKATSFPASVGVAMWAYVSPEVDARLSANLQVPIKLAPDEWRSGEILWLVDAVGTPQATMQLVQGLGQTVFKGQPFKLRATDEQGQAIVKTIQPGPKPA